MTACRFHPPPGVEKALQLDFVDILTDLKERSLALVEVA